jgi:hypothetical protein
MAPMSSALAASCWRGLGLTGLVGVADDRDPGEVSAITSLVESPIRLQGGVYGDCPARIGAVYSFVECKLGP